MLIYEIYQEKKEEQIAKVTHKGLPTKYETSMTTKNLKSLDLILSSE